MGHAAINYIKKKISLIKCIQQITPQALQGNRCPVVHKGTSTVHVTTSLFTRAVMFTHVSQSPGI